MKPKKPVFPRVPELKMCIIPGKNFLNIPGPSTGHDGDPNISIKLDEEIVAAVAKFLGD